MSNKELNIEKYFKENYTYLLLLSFSIVKDKDASEDIVQEFFLSVWQKKGFLIFNNSFKAYSTKAIKNLSIIYLEKINKEKLKMAQLKLDHLNYTENNEAVVPSGFNPKILCLLNKLPEKRRKILVSSVIHGHKYSDIAEDNNISINTVKTQIKRAYAFLQENYNYAKILILMVHCFTIS